MPDDKQIPAFNSYEEMAEFWDTHSLADYWDQTEPAAATWWRSIARC